MSTTSDQIEIINRKITLQGFKRAQVIQTDIDNNQFGVIRVFIPILMTNLMIEKNKKDSGIFAYPANNPCGGRNSSHSNNSEEYYQGSVNIPALDSWVWVFFEDSNINQCFYMNGIDIENTMLPPENRVDQYNKKLKNPHTVHTLYKSHDGRAIQIADSEDVARVEITGKKRALKSPKNAIGQTIKNQAASGDANSAYQIDGNMTTILLDESKGRDKLLIRDHKGNFINLYIVDGSLQIELNSSKQNISDTNNIVLRIAGSTITNIEQNANTYIQGAEISQVNGTSDKTVLGNQNIHICGNVNLTVGETKSGERTTAVPLITDPIGQRES